MNGQLSEDSRSYHSASSSTYSLPNDAKEHERLDIQAVAITRMLHDEPIKAPVAEPRRILEVGSGTGGMANYFAQRFPKAEEVIGVDLSPVPQKGIRKGVRFLQGDFRKLVQDSSCTDLRPASFDYSFSRMLLFGMVDWPGYIAHIKELLVPGGWIELQEIDFHYFDGNENLLSDSKRFYGDQRAAFLENGVDLVVGSKLGRYVKEAGFTDVQVREYAWVVGKFKGHPETDMIGEYSSKYLPDTNFGAYKRILGPKKSKEEMDEDEMDMRSAYGWNEEGRHKKYYVVCGKKP